MEDRASRFSPLSAIVLSVFNHMIHQGATARNAGCFLVFSEVSSLYPRKILPRPAPTQTLYAPARGQHPARWPPRSARSPANGSGLSARV
ncbi:hypothetical protein TC41_1163 [Alicyclobacillus acidocaldarius subsp. acidocaldarius Tc-4-1]|uniref:Uncharacterized protein n=1 Tax=Alicyclobacillus acidocaldarius (strain Tc-4-1) TaxID=1048834 RepID=F8IGU2_ALIAT|nr:hypothetical protein TC41_1163 [Alicyclobacillus acidocaldarius subsp. acidocaldarius Tc-4-1]